MHAIIIIQNYKRKDDRSVCLISITSEAVAHSSQMEYAKCINILIKSANSLFSAMV